MARRRVSASEITIGAPIRWDVYSQKNELLLRRGYVLTSHRQLNILIERGLFIEVSEAPEEPGYASSPSRSVSRHEIPSAIRLINKCNRQLEQLLFNLEHETGLEEKILAIERDLERAIDIHKEVSLASILMNHEGRYSVRHCLDSAIVAIIFGRGLNKPPSTIRSLACAAMTMNASMLDLQDALQCKKEAPSEEEMQCIRNHPLETVALLRKAGVRDKAWLSYVLDHHENEDGTGYPNGKTSAELSEETKVLAIVDRYTARVSSRLYRKAQLPHAAFRAILIDDKNALFPDLATILVKQMGVYPAGTYVRLENGEIGIVAGCGSSTTTPIVSAVLSPRGEPYIHPLKRDTAIAPFLIKSVIDEKTASVWVSMQKLWGEFAAP